LLVRGARVVFAEWNCNVSETSSMNRKKNKKIRSTSSILSTSLAKGTSNEWT
jgi:hypothetical protein